jgi:hypothetical protein
MVDKRITEFSLVFVLVGMMFLVPAITGEALGLTIASLEAYDKSNHNPHRFVPSFVEERLDEGQWSAHPQCTAYGVTPDYKCTWTTTGGGFSGPEAGHVIYDYYHPNKVFGGKVAKVVFRWYNPRSGTNTCGAVVLEKVGNVEASCRITQGNNARATYEVFYYG